MIYRGRQLPDGVIPPPVPSAQDPQLAAQGYSRTDELSYEAFMAECERDEEDRVASGGLQLCPDCGHRSVAVGSRWTRQYGGGYDTYYECANPACDYAEVCV